MALPRDWLRKDDEPQHEDSWWEDVKMVLGVAAPVLLVLASLAGIAYALLQLSG